MTTTFARIRAVLGEMQDAGERTPAELIDALIKRDQNRNESNFHVMRGKPPSRTPLSPASIRSLFRLMRELKLIRETPGERLIVEAAVANTLGDDSRYRELVSRRTMDMLESAGTSYVEIKSVAESIHLPDVRDPETILKQIQAAGHGSDLTDRGFSQLLFILACAGRRADRRMRVFYEFA